MLIIIKHRTNLSDDFREFKATIAGKFDFITKLI